MYVYVDDVDDVVAQLRAEAVRVLKDPADMPWGERIATIADPDGNPVALSNEPSHLLGHSRRPWAGCWPPAMLPNRMSWPECHFGL
jgi:hypothetical protein